MLSVSALVETLLRPSSPHLTELDGHTPDLSDVLCVDRECPSFSRLPPQWPGPRGGAHRRRSDRTMMARARVAQTHSPLSLVSFASLSPHLPCAFSCTHHKFCIICKNNVQELSPAVPAAAAHAHELQSSPLLNALGAAMVMADTGCVPEDGTHVAVRERVEDGAAIRERAALVGSTGEESRCKALQKPPTL